MANWKIPLFVPDFTEEDIRRSCEPIRDGWLTMGERTTAFEAAFAETIGVKHAFAVANGTAALHLALICAGVKTGDEVLLPALTFVACANTITSLGAKPVFVDSIGEHDLTISPGDIRRKINEKTRAVMVVHYAGFPCRMDEILLIAHEYNLVVIEDCAHAIITTHHDKKCGAIGDVGAFSFFSNKNMTTGEGGMVATQHDDYAERLRKIRSHGMTTLTLDRHEGRAVSYDVVEPGFNYRIDEIRSALGLSQLQRLFENLRNRREVYRQYTEILKDVEEISIPFLDRAGEEIGYHIYPILLKNNGKRADLIQKMREDGIQTSIHYPFIPHFTAYKIASTLADCPTAERISAAELTLPFYPQMTEEDVNRVCDSLKRNL